MKISQTNIDKIRNRIINLSASLNDINKKHPSDITCAMGATISSLSHILDEIDIDVKIETNGYLTFIEFQDKILGSDVYYWYHQYRIKYVKDDENNMKFYHRNIDEINKVFVSKF